MQATCMIIRLNCGRHGHPAGAASQHGISICIDHVAQNIPALNFDKIFQGR
jgi:hypothetical protein